MPPRDLLWGHNSHVLFIIITTHYRCVTVPNGPPIRSSQAVTTFFGAAVHFSIIREPPITAQWQLYVVVVDGHGRSVARADDGEM